MLRDPIDLPPIVSVELIQISGNRKIFGFNKKVMGQL